MKLCEKNRDPSVRSRNDRHFARAVFGKLFWLDVNIFGMVSRLPIYLILRFCSLGGGDGGHVLVVTTGWQCAKVFSGRWNRSTLLRVNEIANGREKRERFGSGFWLVGWCRSEGRTSSELTDSCLLLSQQENGFEIWKIKLLSLVKFCRTSVAIHSDGTPSVIQTRIMRGLEFEFQRGFELKSWKDKNRIPIIFSFESKLKRILTQVTLINSQGTFWWWFFTRGFGLESWEDSERFRTRILRGSSDFSDSNP